MANKWIPLFSVVPYSTAHTSSAVEAKTVDQRIESLQFHGDAPFLANKPHKIIAPMLHDPTWFADNKFLFAQGIADGVSDLGEKMEDLLQDMDAIPGNDLTEVLEEEDGQAGQGPVRNGIVTFMFKNPLLKALLGTQAGWGLVLVFSLIVIGQAFEMLKETISKNLPERFPNS